MTPDPAFNELEIAIRVGDRRRVCRLLDADRDLITRRFTDNLDLTPLMWASRNRRGSIVAELIDRGADVNLTNRVEANGDGGNTALWFVAQGASPGTTDIADRLIRAGASVNQGCEHGQTALYVAAMWCHLDCVQLLWDHHADALIPDSKGQTPLDAVRAGLAWCHEQQTLTSEQRRFAGLAPATVAFLETATRSA